MLAQYNAECIMSLGTQAVLEAWGAWAIGPNQVKRTNLMLWSTWLWTVNTPGTTSETLLTGNSLTMVTYLSFDERRGDLGSKGKSANDGLPDSHRLCVCVDHVADSSYLTKKRKSCSVRKPRVGTTGPSPEQLWHTPLCGNQPAAEDHQLLWKQDLLKDAPCPQ